jgi:hypothetical protein
MTAEFLMLDNDRLSRSREYQSNFKDIGNFISKGVGDVLCSGEALSQLSASINVQEDF